MSSLSENIVIVAIIVLGAVVTVAIWLGRGLQIRARKNKLDISVSQESRGAAEGVSVAKNISLERSRAGDVIGVESEGGSEDSVGSVTVADNMRAVDSKVGNIVGIKRNGK